MALICPLPSATTPAPGEPPVEPDEGPITPPGPPDPENPLPIEHPKT